MIARQSKEQNETSAAALADCCSTVDYAVFSENYRQLKGYHEDADLGLGCGILPNLLPSTRATVCSIWGSGAGNDCFVARAIVGETGKVVGIDFTDAMLRKRVKQGQTRLSKMWNSSKATSRICRWKIISLTW